MSKSKLRIRLVNIAKKHTAFRKLARKLLLIERYIIFKIRGLGRKTNPKTVMFFAFKGRSYACSPKAIYEYMLSDKQYEDYQYIWAFKEPEKYQYLTENPRTKVIPYGGKEYEKNLAIAKYWVFNYRVADHIYPKKNQVYIQCWHGTPLKKLGYDLKNTNNAMNSESEIHAKYRIDAQKFQYLLSPSKFASEKFSSAWNLKAVGKEDAIIEEGYPRNDFLYTYTQDELKTIKERLQIPKDKKVILYAPTWRDDQHETGVGYVYQTEVDFDQLQEKLQDEYVILFRAHYLVANSFDFAKYENFVYDVSNVDDINELYIIADMLITDYSSVFFDYANLKRPMIFYMYDFAKYEEKLRGFYMDIAELPGPIVQNQEDLLVAIEQTKNFQYDEKYQKFNKKYNYLDDGKAAQRVVRKCIQ